jgi:hypothetical protein
MADIPGLGINGDQPIVVRIDDEVETIRVDPRTGTIEQTMPDGSVKVNLDADKRQAEGTDDKWFRNLIDDIDDIDLSVITNELVEGIEADNQSRQESLATHARGLDLLGIKLEEPKGDAQDGGTVSSVTNPLLLEACLKGWANAEAELLPAAGPVKVETTNANNAENDELAERLEAGFNYYLTKTATEYYPDTSHMLLWGTYFRGAGFKKIYRCPMRRRPVSESVAAQDLIMSDTTKDFYSCGRITHEITLRPSMFKRMQMLGVYKKGNAGQPNSTPNEVDEKIAGIQGTQAVPSRPEDKPYTVWESQCELNLNKFIPADSPFRDQNIPLPYLVSIDKDSKEILSVRRDWDKEDENCHRLRMYVKYPYVPGPGAYGTGMLNILGNASAAMTAAWREAIDCGMFANFPGGLIAKLGARQESSNLRPSPGEFHPVETNGMSIKDVVTEFPYKDVTPGLMTLIDKITEQCRALSQGAEIPAGEGLQNIPVGTMLAQIEQATKVMAAAHKGMHKAQGEEIEMLAELFRRNPEDFWRGNDEAGDFWDETKLLQALKDKRLRPVSDPNIPSHIHRIAKALGLIQLLAVPAFSPLLSAKEALMRCLAAMREDPKGLVVDAPPVSAPDPKAAADMVGAQAKMMDSQSKIAGVQVKQQETQLRTASKAAELASQERIRDKDITKELIIHQQDAAKVHVADERNAIAENAKTALAANAQQHDQLMDHKAHALETAKAGIAAHEGQQEHGLNLATHALESERAAHEAAVNVHEALNPPQPAAAKPKPKAKK